MKNAEPENGNEERLAGGGKMPSGRSRLDHAKPYDRGPSVFGRICSAVKGMIIPAYFTDTLSRVNDRVEESNVNGNNGIERSEVPIRENVYKETIPIIEARSGSSSTVPLSNVDGYSTVGFQRRPLESFQTPFYGLERTSVGSSSSSGLTDNRHDNLSTLPSNTEVDPRHYRATQMSEINLNGNSSSKSLSSGMKFPLAKAQVTKTAYSDTNISRPVVLPDNNDTFLWSSRHKMQPSFDVSMFCEAVDETRSNVTKLSLVNKSVSSRVGGASLFYTGQTAYGGAAAASKMNRNEMSSPYQRRGAVQQRVTAKPSGALGDAGVTSSTSRRILDAMRKGEDGRASVRSNRSHDSSDGSVSFAITTPSVSTFHRNSAQFDATVANESLFANRERYSAYKSSLPGASMNTITTDPISNGENGHLFSTSTVLKEVVVEKEASRKMKKAPIHYSCRQDDETITPDPILSSLQPLPSININPGFLGISTSSKSGLSFAFSMPKENINNESVRPVVKEILYPALNVKDRGGFQLSSVSQNSVSSHSDFRASSNFSRNVACNDVVDSVTCGSVIESGSAVVTSAASLSSQVSLGALFRKSLDTWNCTVCLVVNSNDKSACVACMSAKPGSLPGSPCSDQSVPNQVSESSSNAQSNASGGLCINASGGIKFGSNSNVFGASKFVVDQSSSNNSAPNVTSFSNASSASSETLFAVKPTVGAVEADLRDDFQVARSKENLPTIIQDNILSRPPLRNDGMKITWPAGGSSSPSIMYSIASSPPDDKREKPMPNQPEQTSKTNESSTVKPLSDLFKKSFDSWTCDNCFVTNKSEAATCVSCEIARQGPIPPSVHAVNEGMFKLPVSSTFAVEKTEPMFPFGTQPQQISVTSGGQEAAAASGFNPVSTGLFQSKSLPVQVSSSAGSTQNSSVTKNLLFNAPDSSSDSNSAVNNSKHVPVSGTTSSTAPMFAGFHNNTSVDAPMFGSQSTTISNATSIFSVSETKSLNTAPMFGTAAEAMPVFGGASLTKPNTTSLFGAVLPTSSTTPTIDNSSFALPQFGSVTATTKESGLKFSGFPGISAGGSGFGVQSTTTTSVAPMIFGFTSSGAASLLTAASTTATMFGSTTTSASSMFNYTPSIKPILGNSSSSVSTVTFGTSNPTLTTSSIGQPALQFSMAVTTASTSNAFPSDMAVPFFGSLTTTATAPMFGVSAPATSVPMFGLQAVAGSVASAFGSSQAAPLFGQQHNPPMFGQLNAGTSNSSAVPFAFGSATTTTTNSAYGFQMSSAVAPTFFGSQPTVASTVPSGFGSSVFSAPTFGTVKSDSVPAGFGAPGANMEFGASNGIRAAVPSFGAVGVAPMFGAPAVNNAQSGIVPMFGAAAPATQSGTVPMFGAAAPATVIPTFAFGTGAQTASNLFAFGGASSGAQCGDSSKIGHSNKRALDTGSNSVANPAKRSSAMFGNVTPAAQPFAFGSDQQPPAASNMWNQQQPSAGASSGFSTTLPSTGFNFGGSSTQFGFQSNSTGNSGAVFQFGSAGSQQPAPSTFNAAPNAFNANSFNANTSNVAPNPFDIAPTANSTNRVIKKGVRRMIPKR